MKNKKALSIILLTAAAGILTWQTAAQRKGQPRLLPNRALADGAKTLPNGWRVTPAGRHIRLPGDMPLRMIVTPDGQRLLVNTGGYHDHDVNVIDIASEKLVQTVDLGKDWDGMAMEPKSGDVFDSGGGRQIETFHKTFDKTKAQAQIVEGLDRPVLRLRYADGRLGVLRALSIEGLAEKDRFVTGVTVAPNGALLVLNTQTDSLYRMSGDGFKVQRQVKAGYRPYAAVVSRDGKQIAVSNWGDESVSLLDAGDLHETARIKTGSHPNDLAYAKDGRLFVANAGSNSVSVIEDGKVKETIRTSLDPKALVGTTPDALVLSPDGKRLFVANADNNDVAAIDISDREESKIMGFIPTGWYPSSLAISQDGKKLFIGTAKGLEFRANFPVQTKYTWEWPNPKQPYDYIPGVLTGTVSVVDIPDEAQLAAYTKQVRQNVPVPETQFDSAFAKRIETNVFPKIKHVLYVIRENRSYDQVFGDIGIGNSDPSLTMFGRKVTPNAHAWAKQFVLLDNLYCNGEVSDSGHQWTDAAYATHFTERTWINKYSRRGLPDNDVRLSGSPAGYIWDNCQRHGVTYRTYGEMARFAGESEKGPQYRFTTGLKDHASLEYLKYRGHAASDSDHARVFLDEFREAEKTGEWPQFMIMALPEDHTEGLNLGTLTPVAHVANNDQALAQIVEAISKSRFWKETAIFVIEDDAQNGPDHVDAHRTVGLVLSPYVKRGVVDSTLYTTSSYLRTMEMMLGLPPMTQYDSLATPMYNTFTETPLFTLIRRLPAEVDLNARNLTDGPGPKESAELDWSDFDRADPDKLNAILWAALKPGQPMPAPVRSANLMGR